MILGYLYWELVRILGIGKLCLTACLGVVVGFRVEGLPLANTALNGIILNCPHDYCGDRKITFLVERDCAENRDLVRPRNAVCRPLMVWPHHFRTLSADALVNGGGL